MKIAVKKYGQDHINGFGGLEHRFVSDFIPVEGFTSSIVCIDHISLIHSLVDGHLGCFRLLAIGNNVNISL